jgi:hypothetical protein
MLQASARLSQTQAGSDQPDALPGVTSSAVNARGKVLGFWEEVKTRFSDGGWYQHEQKTLADRNNNPGNIRPVGGGGFRAFGSALEGWEAMKNQLMRYFTGKRPGAACRPSWISSAPGRLRAITTTRSSMPVRLLDGWAFADGSA